MVRNREGYAKKYDIGIRTFGRRQAHSGAGGRRRAPAGAGWRIQIPEMVF